MESPLKTKNRVAIRSSGSTHGHVSGENHNSKRYIHPNFHCSTVDHRPNTEVANMSINRGMDREDVVHIYNRIIFSHLKKNMK